MPPNRDRDPDDMWALRFAGLIISGGATLAAIVTILSLTVLPQEWGSDGIPEPDPATATVEQELDAASAKRSAENNVRDTGLKVAAGVAAIAAALVGYGRLELARADHRRQERGQENDRFTRAIDQLGSQSQEIRLGGVYALEQFFRDVQAEREPTTKVLAAFVRSSLPRLDDVPAGRAPAPLPVDIVAAFSVLGGFSRNGFGSLIDLSGIDAFVQGHYRLEMFGGDLRGVNMFGVNLHGAYLIAVDLRAANLRGADLTDADLRNSDLTGSSLFEAELRGADLTGADLTGADLRNSDLTGSNLSLAKLRDADLRDADLTGADLTGADLTGADLGRTLTNATLWNESTRWPADFAPPDQHA